MKIAVALAAVGFAVIGLAAPADQCQIYKNGQKSCYTATVTVADADPCPYKTCPGLKGCHAEWLMTYTTKVIPCKNRCCPTTATTTVTTPCTNCPTTCTPMFTETLYRYGSECQATAVMPKGPNAAQLAAAEAAAPTPTPTLRPIEEEYDYINSAEIRALQEQLRRKDLVINRCKLQEFYDIEAKRIGVWGRQQHIEQKEREMEAMMRAGGFSGPIFKREMPPLSLNPDGSVATPSPHPIGPGGRRPVPADAAAVETTTPTPTPIPNPTHHLPRVHIIPTPNPPDAPDGNLRVRRGEDQRGNGYWTEDPVEGLEHWHSLVKKPEDVEKTEAEIDIEWTRPVNHHTPESKDVPRDEPQPQADAAVPETAPEKQPTPVSKDGETPTEAGPFQELWSIKPGFGHGPTKPTWHFTGWPKPPTIEPLPPILNPPHGLPGGGGKPGEAANIEVAENVAPLETNVPAPVVDDKKHEDAAVDAIAPADGGDGDDGYTNPKPHNTIPPWYKGPPDVHHGPDIPPWAKGPPNVHHHNGASGENADSQSSEVINEVPVEVVDGGKEVEAGAFDTPAGTPTNGANNDIPKPVHSGPPKTMGPPPGITIHPIHHKPDTKPDALNVDSENNKETDDYWNPKFGHGPIETSPDYDGPIIDPPKTPWPPKTHQWPAENAVAEVGAAEVDAAENENATPTDDHKKPHTTFPPWAKGPPEVHPHPENPEPKFSEVPEAPAVAKRWFGVDTLGGHAHHGLPSEGDDAPKNTEGDGKKTQGGDKKAEDVNA